ncbi:MAG: Rpn family recombination-promoting nuclease/putative transposase [Desulfomonilaceae bacterium]|nr:Rpn family recombination-promoting nuclease/putative transposase [Desulfomonilaceae bacterium]
MADMGNPHDRFFKEVFSRPDVAEDFLFHFLPHNVSCLLRPGTFLLSKDSFVDANLKEYFSDLLYQVDFKDGEQGFVYILFEHKSYPAPDIAFQLLRYMTRIWEYASKRIKDSLPPVIPVVLYHGKVQWSIPLNFASLYRAPESLKGSLWDFTYTLCDLSVFSDEEIKLGVMAKVALLLLKHVHSEDLAERLVDILGLLPALTDQSSLKFLETVMRYLGTAAETVTMEDCRKAVKATFPGTGEIFMERWIEEIAAERHQEWMAEGLSKGLKEGLEKGLEKGLTQGAAAVTIRLLSRKLGDLDTTVRERIRHLSFEELERLGEDLLDFRDKSALTEWLDRVEKSP